MTTFIPRRISVSRLLALVYFSLGCFSVVSAQSATGTIEGRISNPATGAIIPGVQVTLEGTTRETFTDADGNYRLTQVPVGTVQLKAFLTGFPSARATLTVAAGQTVERDFQLVPATAAGAPFAWRLNMDAAIERVGTPLAWMEFGDETMASHETVAARPQDWGDVVLARRDVPTSYHLSVVVDDALQGVTHVVRGQDLFHATSVHRLLQVLLGLPQPVYRHHGLVLGDDGRKLSKSNRDTGIAAYREKGLLPADLCLLFARNGLVLD